MARVLKNKTLENIRLATNYGGWMYCTQCNENIGYLCYSTYDKLELTCKCKCGNIGKAILDFEDSKIGQDCNKSLILVKNRFCCPKDSEPLITILDNKVANYKLKITCKSCEKTYVQEK